jgi:hypothetical protein
VQIDASETTSGAAGRFVLTIDPSRGVNRAFAIHDDYEVASVDVRPSQVVGGIDLLLNPSPDRNYLRVRGHDVCTERPLDPLGAPRLATFPVQRPGQFGVVEAGLVTPFTGSSTLLYRVPPGGGKPIEYSEGEPLEGGYTYNWLEVAD